ncbi:hypothetical protein ACG83_09140 [Frankia sp. R43]|nr:hypothetical protein ACG83_09140 [Frankia sp. R43]
MNGGSGITDAVRRLVREAEPCPYCGSAATETDHIWALSRGGPDTVDNLSAICSSCNREKHARLLTEWEATPGGREKVQKAVKANPRIRAEYERLTSTDHAPALPTEP